MTPRTPLVPARWRRTVRAFAVLGVALSGLGLVGEIADALPPGTPPAGSLTLTPTTGTSSTAFTITPPNGAACPGDNTAKYLYHTFITPASNDPADFLWSASGTPQGEPAFTNNLANATGTRVRNVAPGLGDGLLLAQRNLSFTNAPLFGALTPGDYLIGIACTLPDAPVPTTTAPPQDPPVPTDPPLPPPDVIRTVRFWTVPVTITGTLAGGNLAFAGPQPPPPSSSTTTTTTTSTTLPSTGSSTSTTTTTAGTTSTTVAGATTTTNPCPTGTTSTTTSTTLAGATTTTTVAGATTTNPCVTTTTVAGLGAGGNTTTTVRIGSAGATLQTGGTGSAGQSLANTGTASSTPMIVLWGVLLLVFGRMVVLTAKPIRLVDER